MSGRAIQNSSLIMSIFSDKMDGRSSRAAPWGSYRFRQSTVPFLNLAGSCMENGQSDTHIIPFIVNWSVTHMCTYFRLVDLHHCSLCHIM